jgi:hypothetical protein
MDQQRRIQCMDALRGHEEQASKLLHTLSSLRSKAGVREDTGVALSPDVVLFTAQLIRHRISAALLTSELAAT